MRTVLKDKELQEEFDQNGFILSPSFLSTEEIKYLHDLFDQNDAGINSGFHASSHVKSSQYRKLMHEKISDIFTPKAQQYLKDYKPIYGSYTVKEPGAESFFDFHLDWTMVNEREYISISVWCPLTDVNAENGHLWILKGSHKMGDTIRGGPGLFLYTETEYPKLLEKKFEKVELSNKAGDAVIYDHRLFHGSPPNLTNVRRLAINFSMIPQETSSWHYHRNEEGKLEIFKVDTDFYNTYIMGTKPSDVDCVDVIEVKDSFLHQHHINSLIAN